MLSIIIVNFKNPALLRLSLKSIGKSIKSGFDHEIIVVDVESYADTQNVVLEEFPKVKLVPFKENIGYTKGVNEGIKNSRGDCALILNSDIVPIAGSIENLYYFMKSDKNIGISGPQLLNFDGTPQNSCFRFYTPMTIVYRRTFLGKLWFAQKHLKRIFLTDKDLSKTSDVDWLMGSAMMISKEAVKKVGLMDENLYLYMSDIDWPKRFWENGFRVVYHPESKMYHYHRRQSKGRFNIFDAILEKLTRQHIIDALKYYRKYGLKNYHYTN